MIVIIWYNISLLSIVDNDLYSPILSIFVYAEMLRSLREGQKGVRGNSKLQEGELLVSDWCCYPKYETNGTNHKKYFG
jgi:hypothetical protein